MNSNILGWLLVALFSHTAVSLTTFQLGEKLYLGRAELHATLGTGKDELSPEAATCANCHGHDGRGVAESGVRGSDIRYSSLTKTIGRRGGPPSRYTAATFCDVLRLGHDAAGVVLSRAMPRYRVSSTECGALWAYLSEIEQRRR